MQPETDALERLISRFLDDEATPNQRRALHETMRRDPAARALFDQTAELDREVSSALQSALGGPRILRPRMVTRHRISPWVAGLTAAAASVAAWFAPGYLHMQSNAGNGRSSGPMMSSVVPSANAPTPWFSPSEERTGDRYTPDPATIDRPHQRFRETHRDWIVVPGRVPGEYMLIEVNQSRDRVKYEESGT